MSEKYPMQDVIVLIPGIMGSVLQKEGRDIWAISGQAIWNVISDRNSSLEALRVNQPDLSVSQIESYLERDPHALDEVGGGLRATKIMPDAHLIPGIWKIDGYSNVRNTILNHFDVTEGDLSDDRVANYFEFPYDWRLDNRIAAYRLKYLLEKRLYAWRVTTNASNAKFIFICHSMGGLVARYYLEVMQGWRESKRLITFGTPYRGSLNALDYLVNGFKKATLNFTDVVRTSTSIYQLLPNYQSVKQITSENSTDTRIVDLSIPNVDPARVNQAMDFHAQIADAVEKNKAGKLESGLFRVDPIVGSNQPTHQSGILENGTVKMATTVLEPRFARLFDGDGTVPLLSAMPPEQIDSVSAAFFAETHSSIQNNKQVLEHVIKLLEFSQLEREEFSNQKSVMSAIRLKVDDLYLPEEPIRIQASVNSSSPPPLQLQIKRADGSESKVIPFGTADNNWQEIILEGLKPGLYRIAVGTVERLEMFNPVHDFFEVAG
ncbi:MAG: hypothetical protein RLZZ156_732 [Deinococcota bacterium]|jgi:hypothetical protein